MVMVVNQEFEGDSHGSGGNTSSIDQVGRLDASTEAEMQRLMIRLYKEILIPADQFGDGKNHGAGGSTSLIDELLGLSVSTEAEMELIMRIYKDTICPMILADINAKEQKFLSLIIEIFGIDLLMNKAWNLDNTASTSGSQGLQLQFLNGISTAVSTQMKIEGKDHKPFVVALVEGNSGKIVTTGAAAAMEVEIVVLEGDCNNDEAENWTADEFNNKIVSKWKGKKVLQGNTFLNLKEGVGSIDKISFTHNSAWKEKKIVRLGAKAANAVIATSVKEAISESFLVRDKRTLLYNKHEIPLLSDPVYRLKMISNRGDCFKRLWKAKIKTVMDILTFDAINPKKLKDLLGVPPNTWKVIMDHAKVCKDDKGLYLYHHQREPGVVFNIKGELVGLIAESQFISSDKLPNDKKAGAQKLVKSSTEHWEEVVSFKDETSLMKHVHSSTPLSSLCNGLSVVLPETIDQHEHGSLTSPQVSTPIFPTNSVNSYGYDSVSMASPSQSQSPKRPASELSVINSLKKLRDDHHPQISPSTPSVGTSNSMTNTNFTGLLDQHQTPNDDLEDEDYMQYLNLFPINRWRTVWCMVGWISVFSEVRNR